MTIDARILSKVELLKQNNFRQGIKKGKMITLLFSDPEAGLNILDLQTIMRIFETLPQISSLSMPKNDAISCLARTNKNSRHKFSILANVTFNSHDQTTNMPTS